jgi:hypothetical protein
MCNDEPRGRIDNHVSAAVAATAPLARSRGFPVGAHFSLQIGVRHRNANVTKDARVSHRNTSVTKLARG